MSSTTIRQSTIAVAAIKVVFLTWDSFNFLCWKPSWADGPYVLLPGAAPEVGPSERGDVGGNNGGEGSGGDGRTVVLNGLPSFLQKKPVKNHLQCWKHVVLFPSLSNIIIKLVFNMYLSFHYCKLSGQTIRFIFLHWKPLVLPQFYVLCIFWLLWKLLYITIYHSKTNQNFSFKILKYPAMRITYDKPIYRIMLHSV